jgi:hypothetical protein
MFMLWLAIYVFCRIVYHAGGSQKNEGWFAIGAGHEIFRDCMDMLGAMYLGIKAIGYLDQAARVVTYNAGFGL